MNKQFNSQKPLVSSTVGEELIVMLLIEFVLGF